MLAVEGILALDHAGVEIKAFLFRRCHQGVGDLQVRNSRKLDRGVLPAGALHADGSGGNHDVAALHRGLHPAACANTDEGVRAAADQLLHGDGGRGTADACGGNADLDAVQRTGIGYVLPVVRYQNGIVKVLGNLHAALGVAGEDDVASHLARGHLDMIETAGVLRIVFHFSPILLRN